MNEMMPAHVSVSGDAVRDEWRESNGGTNGGTNGGMNGGIPLAHMYRRD